MHFRLPVKAATGRDAGGRWKYFSFSMYAGMERIIASVAMSPVIFQRVIVYFDRIKRFSG